MALIDALPLFVPKPLDFSGFKTRLVPRPDAVATDTPTVQPVSTSTTTGGTTTDTGTTASTTATGPTTQPTAPTFIPDELAGYEPVIQELDAAGITNPEARAAIIAQLVNEKGWDPGQPADFNYGNITAGSTWSGPVNIRNDKDKNGNKITQKFRSYTSTREFVQDYLNFLKTLYPESYKQLTSPSFSIDAFTSGLIDGARRYAENPVYKQALKSVYGDVLNLFRNNN